MFRLSQVQASDEPPISWHLVLLQLEVFLNVLLHLVLNLSVLLGFSSSDAEPDTEDIEEEDGETDHNQVLVCPGLWLLEVNLVTESLLQVIRWVTNLRELVYVERLADLAEDRLALHLSCVLLSIDVDRRCIGYTILNCLSPVFFKNRVDVTVSFPDCCVGHAPLDLLAINLERANDSVSAEVADRAFHFQTTEPDVVQVVEPEVSIILIVFVDLIEDALCSNILSKHHRFIDVWESLYHVFIWRGEAVLALLDAV